MKRVIIILVSIMLLLLDNSLSPFISIKGIYPSLLFTFSIAYSIISSREECVFIGVLSGLLQDIFFFNGFGVNALINMFCCLLAGFIGEGIWRSKKIIPVITMFAATAIRAFAIFIVMYLIGVKVDLLRGILSGLYNSIVMFFSYPLIYKLLYSDEEKNNWRLR